ncbi:TRAP transporter small permease subunit [Janibacter sp. GS2]|uniref:TRAP transporter small permease subunit n=1 Tax=Janibacter sp. GS2 TaxID=3442646 RepID=UPI003EB81969
MSDDQKDPVERVPDDLGAEASDVARAGHLHQSAAEQEALARPEWWVVRLPETMGALVVLVLVLVVTTGVVLRVVGQGVLGLIDLASVAMLLLVVMGVSSLSYRDEHVRLELIDAVVGPRGKLRLDIFGDVFQLVVVGVVIYALGTTFLSDLQTGTTSAGELDLPRSWLSGAATLGLAFVWIVLVRKTIHDLTHLRTGRTDHAD